mgnify:FL=1|tara:strand:+ start:1724 stop:1951 length:228 start_codon:yes stop_codon:yes gene_type:complete
MARIDRETERELQHIWTKLDKLEKKLDTSLEMFNEVLEVLGLRNNLIGDDESLEMFETKDKMETELGMKNGHLGS